jgi:ribonuclease III
MPPSLGKLEHLTGHKFADPELIARAVTHRSWVYENMPDAPETKMHETENESLEFLGDAVLGLAITDLIFTRNRGRSEGEMTVLKHHLVSTATLAKLAHELKLGSFLRVGKGEEKTGGRKKDHVLANTLEAIIGAVFVDGGYIPAKAFVSKIFAEELKTATPAKSVDYKSLLQEALQAQKLATPTYKKVRTSGPPHERTFYVEALWEGGKTEGEGNSVKAAEMMAAARALEVIKNGSKLTK